MSGPGLAADHRFCGLKDHEENGLDNNEMATALFLEHFEKTWIIVGLSGDIPEVFPSLHARRGKGLPYLNARTNPALRSLARQNLPGARPNILTS